MEPKIISNGRNKKQNQPLFQTSQKSRSPYRQDYSTNDLATSTSKQFDPRHQHLLMTNEVTTNQDQNSPRLHKPGHAMTNNSEAQILQSADAQSLVSMTKHLMPGDSSTIEEFKNELKQCLRENISHRREIKMLRQAKKESDQKITELRKELEQAKQSDSLDTQKAVKKLEIKNRQLTSKVHEMKQEQENLQKHNKDFKEYFEKQQDRLNALRNVNQNLNKKLHQRYTTARKEPAFHEMEQHWQAAEARSSDLEVSLKTCTGELEAMNYKLRECADQL